MKESYPLISCSTKRHAHLFHIQILRWPSICTFFRVKIQIHSLAKSPFRMTSFRLKNGFAIFSGAIAIGSKRGLMVQVAVWDVAAYVWAVTASMWDVTSSMSDVTASMYDVQVLCGLLLLYMGCYRRLVGRYSHCV